MTFDKGIAALLFVSAGAGEGFSQPISQSTAILLIVIILGASIYLWRIRVLRSRAALLAVAMVLAALVYLAVTANPIAGP